jgi:hypothetical protein
LILNKNNSTIILKIIHEKKTQNITLQIGKILTIDGGFDAAGVGLPSFWE